MRTASYIKQREVPEFHETDLYRNNEAASRRRIIPIGRTDRKAASASRIAGTLLLLFLLIVPGLTTPVSAADPPLSAFGKGAVEVRVYTDYFCGPCGAEEKEVMAAITELVAKDRIRVIFIDTPVHPETVLYAGYFLAAVNAKREFSQAVKARAALFEAAGLEIRGKAELESFLAKEGSGDPAVRHRPRLRDAQ